MRPGKGVRAFAGVVLLTGGLLAALPTPYRQRAFLIPAKGCNLETDVMEPKLGAPKGVVVVLHGLAANKKIMSYFAEAFAAQQLRVFVPDLPGHGHSRTGFSPRREQECSDALLEQLYQLKLAEPGTTIIAGHSMGGALALKASMPGAAGVVALSPAPMQARHGVTPENLLFGTSPREVRNALIISGTWELQSMRANAADLAGVGSSGSQHLEIAQATHVSLLFDPRVMRAAQNWAARLLHLPPATMLPSHRALLAFLCGFAGILLLAGPFLRELCGNGPPGGVPVTVRQYLLAVAKVLAASLFAVVLLEWWNPARAIRVFQGDYLAGFALIAGVPLLVLEGKRPGKDGSPTSDSGRNAAGTGQAAAAAFAALALLLLVTGWFELTISEAWLNAPRWWRLPFLAIAFFPYLWAEELLLGGMESKAWRRLAAGTGLRAVPWLILFAGIFVLHSGEVLVALLVPYFALLTVFQRRGMDIVRNGTGSAAAAAVFGAILLAGFCLVIFPIT